MSGSTSIHFVKYSMATMRYFIWRIAKRKRPKMSIPKYGKVRGYKLTTIAQLVRDTNQHAFDTARIVVHTSRNPSS